MLDDGVIEPRGDDNPEADLRVMIVDQHDLFRRGLRRLLDEQDGVEVVADARSAEEAVRWVAKLRPDVIVMDVNMPGISGIEAIPDLLVASPQSAILMLTVSADEDSVVDAVLAGASGYLLKDASLAVIVQGVRAAAAGEALISPAVAGSLLARVRQCGSSEAPPGVDPDLSPRELEVLRLIAAGCENSEIGKHLHLSASTVKRHVSNTLEKLGVDNRIQAAVLAVRLGLVTDNGPSSAASATARASDRDPAAGPPAPVAMPSDRADS